MVNYNLQDLTQMIIKCCSANKSNEGDDPSNRYGFSIDFTKLENTLLHKKTNLHVIALNNSSRVPNIADLQLLTEYIRDSKVFDIIFNGKTEFVEFMLYSTEGENGIMELTRLNEEDKLVPISDKELFDYCNVNADPDGELDTEFIKTVCRDMPCYRIIVTRSFYPNNDRFDYKVNIRSNFAMISFQKSLKEEVSEEKEEEK